MLYTQADFLSEAIKSRNDKSVRNFRRWIASLDEATRSNNAAFDVILSGTLVKAAAIIAAATTVSIAPLATSNAMAAPNGNTTTTCVHNGNDAHKCTGGSSTTVVTCTKTNGKYGVYKLINRSISC